MKYQTKKEVEASFDEKTENINLESNGDLCGVGSISDWLAKNQEKHLYSTEVYGEPMLDLDADKIKDFINSLRTADLDALIEHCEGMKYSLSLLGTPETTERVVNAVNSTLNDLISHLKELKETNQ